MRPLGKFLTILLVTAAFCTAVSAPVYAASLYLPTATSCIWNDYGSRQTYTQSFTFDKKHRIKSSIYNGNAEGKTTYSYKTYSNGKVKTVTMKVGDQSQVYYTFDTKGRISEHQPWGARFKQVPKYNSKNRITSVGSFTYKYKNYSTGKIKSITGYGSSGDVHGYYQFNSKGYLTAYSNSDMAHKNIVKYTFKNGMVTRVRCYDSNKTLVKDIKFTKKAGFKVSEARYTEVINSLVYASAPYGDIFFSRAWCYE